MAPACPRPSSSSAAPRPPRRSASAWRARSTPAGAILPDADRRRIEPLAEDLKDQAFALRGAPDRAQARAELFAANETFAAALVETAEADPELGEIEVHELREDLRRELERLADADIKAWRTRREASPPPG